MSFLKEEFDLLLQHQDWDEQTILCIKDLYANLKSYKYLLNKYTINNISDILKVANNLKHDLKTKQEKIESQEKVINNYIDIIENYKKEINSYEEIIQNYKLM